ncbi:MAG: DUF6544 family protein [Brooklawnia sp.]|uniref:DUF6544 family protein n=1 Tax=Brooklawnia sp. TaxID=2699740 RepID=UPI003C7265CE
MKGLQRAGLITGGVLLAVAGLVAIGLRVRPAPFPAYSAQAAETPPTVPVPAGLPDPVERFYRTGFGDEVPVIRSAVFTGSARLRPMGFTMPGRFRFTHDAGQAYRHYIEATIWGLPVLKVNERYVDDVGLMELPFETVEDEPRTNAAANLGLWGESVWLSPIYLTDERVRWEAIDQTHARLIVPFEDSGEDEFTVTFDPNTHLITRMEAMRWRAADSEEKTRWILDAVRWETVNGFPLMVDSTVTWADDGEPWLWITIQDAAYNVDVASYVRQRGL